ncbi:NAD(+)/NADH kinase [Streptacidiphilus sp. ASG 303]|uniref:NAD(+)/NADH kinase n=1 Tax=Streptacidiphilus sp. ASG 303 TaxID=2896847 RepID=UPI001E505EEA|nr:NAD(+)/NADH kinase [Streptacidiphilus sp. ASG 303]MCD0483243.1 NAD(+)/NADH kinase [Streptacidiphilus sp. ASG 303]
MGLVNTVGLVLHPERECAETVATIVEWTRSRGGTVLASPGEAARLDGAAVAVEAGQLVRRADLVLSLGGDGTMLRAMRLAAGVGTPVLGVNVGRLGFLAEVDIPEVPEALCAIDEHRFTVEERSGVRAVGGGCEELAFNDIALVRVPGDRSAAVGIRVDGHAFVSYAADAVIVATPTGSTAYSFSAGGPIVSPGAEGVLVTPVAPHSAFNRALYLSGGEKLELDVLPRSGELAVEADGRVVGRVGPGDSVGVAVLPGASRVVRLGRTTFYQRVQRKLRITGSPEAD